MPKHKITIYKKKIYIEMVNNSPISAKQINTYHLKLLNTKKTSAYGIKYPVPDLGQAQKCGMLNRLIESQLLLIIGSTIQIHVSTKFFKICTDLLSLKQTTHFHKINDKINMDSTIVRSVNVHN